MDISIWRRRALAALGLTAATMAHAGLPLLSEDAGLLGGGECEVEAVAASAREAGSSALEHALGLACGTGSRWQWGLGVARARADGATARGLALGGKVLLWAPSDDAAVVLAPNFGWADEGNGWQHASQDFNLVYSGPLAPDWTLHLNLGHGRDRLADERSTSWSVAAEHAGFAVGGLVLAPMADLAGDDRGAPWWNLGLRATVIEGQLWLGASYARQMDSGRARLATLSVKLAF